MGAASLLVAGTTAQLVVYPNGAVTPFDPNVAIATANHYAAGHWLCSSCPSLLWSSSHRPSSCSLHCPSQRCSGAPGTRRCCGGSCCSLGSPCSRILDCDRKAWLQNDTVLCTNKLNG